MFNIARVLAALKSEITRRTWSRIPPPEGGGAIPDNSPLAIISRIKSRHSLPEIFTLAKALSAENRYLDLIRPADFPREITGVRRTPFLNHASAMAEMAWNAGVLAGVYKSIADFVKKRDAFSSAVLSGNLSEARTILDELRGI